MKAIAEWIRHNQGTFAALIIVCVLLIWTYGCHSKVTSLIDEKKMVTAEELNIELEAESARLQNELEMLTKHAELKKKELAKQDAIKQKLFEFAAISAEGGEVNVPGLLATTFSVLGFGAVVDNRIKDKVIKNRPLIGANKPEEG
ncbi:MAG: hypothetical protein WAV28_18755 [Sedimentisphaerales bacterium]